ncbi:hypothetical protein K523DRAFT_257969, partial [Schizophyllum commune Tattone D]
MDQILAIMFTGPTPPSVEHFQSPRFAPLLVRRDYIRRALQWLRVHHPDYADVQISEERLAQYPEDLPPVTVQYKPADGNIAPEGRSAYDVEPDQGISTGELPFVVHGLTGQDLEEKGENELKGLALKHFAGNGAILRIGHDAAPASMYNNPQLYPQIFPWLFPFG